MRAGACAPPYILSAEAAAALKHSLILSRRRGHAQVTPLHVAATLLTPRTSLLRLACLSSAPPPAPPHHHHPLQCRALELCFNVALNRLPASPAAAVHHHQPSLSNALIASLKRAQAHQRRGCSDQQQHQQPPLVAVKVELEQLTLSILDDPSVSRVMREAGFSSAAVKNNLEDYTNSASSVFQFYNTAATSPPPEPHRPILNPTPLFQPHLFSLSSHPQTPFLSPQKKPHFLCMEDVKCQMKQPPLDLEWDLQSASVSSGGLRLSLSTSGRDSTNAFSENSSPVSDKNLLSLKEETHVLTCCQECRFKYEKEVTLKSFSNKETASAQLPSWLKPHANQTLEKDDLDQLRKKYNKLCMSLHHGNQNPCTNQGYLGRNHYSTSYNPSSSGFSSSKLNQSASTLPRFRRQQPCHVEFTSSNGSSKNRSNEPNLDSLQMMEDKEVKTTLALGNSTYTNEMKHEKFVMWDLLKENVPWQMEAIPSIIEALMDSEATNRDQFLLLQGNDNIAKRRLALVVAESMSGSLICMNMRGNDKTSSEHREMMEIVLRSSNEKVVVLIEDVEFADHELVKFLASVFEAGRRDTGRVIFILTTGGDEICNLDSVVHMKVIVYNTGLQMPTHLDHKRGAGWDPMADRRKVRRSNEMEEVSSGMRRQASPNGLDLNIMADEEEDKLEDLSPVSSDLTTMEPPHNSLTFLNKIKNRFVLNRGSDQDKQAKEMFISQFKRAFREASGLSNLTVEEKVLENVLEGSGLYLNGSFEKWLKDIFQTSLGGVSDEVSVRVCLVGEGGSCEKDGFMGTSLPKRIPVSYIG